MTWFRQPGALTYIEQRVEALAVGDAARLVLLRALHQLVHLGRRIGDVEQAAFLLGDEALVLEQRQHGARALLADARCRARRSRCSARSRRSCRRALPNASSASNTILTWRFVGYVPERKYSWIATSSGENSSTQRAGLPSRPPRPASWAYASSEPGT